MELFLAHGVQAVTIDQIAARAGVAKAGFYRYFRGKAELVEAVVEPVAESFRAAFARCAEELLALPSGRSPAGAYRTLAESLAAVVLSHPEVVRLYLHEARGPADGAGAPFVRLGQELLEGATRLSELALRAGLTRADPPRVGAVMVVGAAELLVARMLAGDDLGDPLELPPKLVSLLLDGLRAAGASHGAGFHQ